jgi:hypothetical protein
VFSLEVRCRRLARGVHFDLPGFVADDAYFDLAPADVAHVTLRGPAGQRPVGTVLAANTVRGAAVVVRRDEQNAGVNP